MIDRELLSDHIRRAEAPNGVPELFPYRDRVGILTIGFGRNLIHKGINPDEAELMFQNDLSDALADAASLSYWERLNDARKMVVADMVFNMGLGRFRGFRKMNAALGIEDYNMAAYEMEDSRWFKQVGRRAKKLKKIMHTGIWTNG
jgi:lysozyme